MEHADMQLWAPARRAFRRPLRQRYVAKRSAVWQPGAESKLTKAHKIQNYPVCRILMVPSWLGVKKHLDVLEMPITEKQVTAVYAMGGYFSIQTPDAMLEASSMILAGGVVMGKPYKRDPC